MAIFRLTCIGYSREHSSLAGQLALHDWWRGRIRLVVPIKPIYRYGTF